MINVKVTCDGCNKEIEFSMVDYSVSMENQLKDFEFVILKTGPFGSIEYEFCKKCMKKISDQDGTIDLTKI